MKPLLITLLAALSLAAATEEIRYTYDKRGRITRVEYSDGRAIAYQYDASGNLTRREFIVPDAPAPEGGASKKQPAPTPAKSRKPTDPR